jgi:hypothetical protein
VTLRFEATLFTFELNVPTHQIISLHFATALRVADSLAALSWWPVTWLYISAALSLLYHCKDVPENGTLQVSKHCS